MNVLSLFDGMSCGQIALDQLGIEVENYYACEIDKWAIKTTKKNYPNTIHLGDVCEVKGKELPKIDLLIGGSPCQGFSFAGKQLNFDDPRSALFFEYVRLLKETKPKYFLLENVRMKQEYQDVISEHLGVKPIMINSSLLSAQNRVRLYWTNIPNITQPEDKGVVLKDILEGGVVDRDKSHCLDANYFKGGNLKSYFEKHRRQLVFSKDGLCHVGDADINGNDSIKRVYHEDGKAPCLTTMGGGNREPKVFCGRIVGRKIRSGTPTRTGASGGATVPSAVWTTDSEAESDAESDEQPETPRVKARAAAPARAKGARRRDFCIPPRVYELGAESKSSLDIRRPCSCDGVGSQTYHGSSPARIHHECQRAPV